LQVYIDILAQPIKLKQHFHLSYTLNGAPGNPDTLYSFGPGQIGVLQLHQNSTAAPQAHTADRSSPHSAVTGAYAQLGVMIKDYMLYQIRYNCANY